MKYNSRQQRVIGSLLLVKGGKLKLGSSSWSLNNERNCMFTKTESFGRVSMVAAVNVSKFEGVTMALPDPILGVSDAFKLAQTNQSSTLELGHIERKSFSHTCLMLLRTSDPYPQ